MSAYHNNQLNMVGLFDPDDGFASLGQPPAMPWPAQNNFGQAAEAERLFNDYAPAPQVNYDFAGGFFQPDHFVADSTGSQDQNSDDEFEARSEDGLFATSSNSPHDNDYVEGSSKARRSFKVTKTPRTPRTPKINKDGEPRKPRQPRPKLLKWSDNDWKNVLLGVVWACGETGVQIPFDQAAQVLGENCTAGALQQALLKLRSKQVADGFQIPALKMAWSRKNRNGSTSSPIASTKTTPAQTPINTRARKSTLQKSDKSLIVTLKLKSEYRGVGTMQLETAKMPIKKQRSGTSESPKRTPTRRPTRQGELQAAQLPQQPVTEIGEPRNENGNDTVKAQAPVHGTTEGQAQLVNNGEDQDQKVPNVNMELFPNLVDELPDLVQDRMLHNRSQAFMDDIRVNGENFVAEAAEAAEALRSFEGIMTPLNNSFGHGYFPESPNQAVPTYGTQYGMAGGHDQQFALGNPQPPGLFEYSDITGYDPFATRDMNQGPFGNVFMDETMDFQPFNSGFFP